MLLLVWSVYGRYISLALLKKIVIGNHSMKLGKRLENHAFTFPVCCEALERI